MRCEYVKVFSSIFTQQESFRVKVGNRNDELAIHALDSMYWSSVGRFGPIADHRYGSVYELVAIKANNGGRAQPKKSPPTACKLSTGFLNEAAGPIRRPPPRFISLLYFALNTWKSNSE